MSWRVAQVAAAARVAPSELVANDGHWYYYYVRVLEAKAIAREKARNEAMRRGGRRRG